jgi:hypothetical protein
LGPFPGRSRPYLRARVGKKKKNTSEGSGGIIFSNLAVVGVADRVKTLAAQGSDDILTAALETPEHRGRVRGVSSSLGWVLKVDFGTPSYKFTVNICTYLIF